MREAHDECGVFGIFDHPDAVRLTNLGIYGNQHRGEESWGEAATDGTSMEVFKSMGLIFDLENRIKGKTAIAHTRYSTAGTKSIGAAQPATLSKERDVIEGTKEQTLENLVGNPIAVAHNGNLTGSLEGNESDTIRLTKKIDEQTQKLAA